MKLDRKSPHPGYWDSPWPVECGGNRRQKSANGRLDAAGPGRVVTRANGRWNVMVVERELDALYLQGTMAAWRGAEPYGWVERIDPESLECLSASPKLPCGGHVWCGAILAHADGSLYTVNGNYLHRLGPNCEVLAERKLPIDRAHNGLLALHDGTLVTKDLRLEAQGGTTISLLNPGDLELMGEPLQLPEGSMGRIASDHGPEGDAIYVPGTEHLWRIHWNGQALEIDEDWRPRYREPGGSQGLAWDSCLSSDAIWSMDNGDIVSVREIFSRHPNGRFDSNSEIRLSWQLPTPWNGPQRLLRFDAVDSHSQSTIAPIGTPGGGIIAPPAYVPEFDMALAWDSINGGLAGLYWRDGAFERAWELDVRPSMQPLIFPESGEFVINDFTRKGRDDLIVIDIETGALKARADTGSRLANGMFLSPGRRRDVYYCSTGTVSRVSWGPA